MSTATEMVSFYLEMEKKIVTGQQVEKDGRRLNRGDLATVVATRKEWEQRVVIESNRGRRHSLATF